MLTLLPTPGGAAAIALLGCGLVYVLGEQGPRGARRTAASAAWLVLMVGLPASITAIYYQGSGPFFC